MSQFGFVALVGRPNVGKSTLVNEIAGTKVAITSPVAQTTRSVIRAIVTEDERQVVFVDTPGVHKPVTLLGERLNDVARRQLHEVDVVCFVLDGASGVGRGDELLASWLPTDRPVVCVVNKVDRMGPAAVAEALTHAARLGDFAAFVPVSALTGDGVAELLGEVWPRLPEGDAMFPDDLPTDQGDRFLVGELVREQLLLQTRDEVPHSVAVLVEEMSGFDSSDPDEVARVECNVFVERESQKGIVVGKGGNVIKAVGTEARRQIEAIFGRRVYLGLRVKVSKDWQRRADRLHRLGY